VIRDLRQMVCERVWLAGVFPIAGGVWAWRSDRQLQAAAVETIATIIPADSPWRGLRFATDQGMVEIRARMRGRHDAVGTKLRIYYIPDDPHEWRRAPLAHPT